VDEQENLARQFEHNRTHLRAVAYRMLGSPMEADDAVQEAWLKVTRAGTAGVENLGGWLTTVVARVCLDMLRARKSRREEPIDGEEAARPISRIREGTNAEQDMLLADSIGLALLVVLQTLAPAERVAFVLHDMFDLPFEQIAPIVGRSPAAARQLASRARRRVRGRSAVPQAELHAQRQIVNAFLTALQGGDFEALVAVLDPDVVVRAEAGAGVPPSEIRGAEVWARSAIAFSRMAQGVRAALINGAPGLVLAPRGRLLRALSFTFEKGKISRVEVIADPARLKGLELSVLSSEF
jgi:RNA polymerase sigma-70 factor (ECF subfamily)